MFFTFVPFAHAFTSSDFGFQTVTATYPNQLMSRDINGTTIANLTATTTSVQETFYISVTYKSSTPRLFEVQLQENGGGSCVFRSDEGNEYATSTTDFAQYTFHSLPDVNCRVAPSANLVYNIRILWGGDSMSGDTKSTLSSNGSTIAYVLTSNQENVNVDISQLIATSSSAFALTNVDEFCGSNFATSTSFLDSIGSSVSGGICRAFAFLFVPNSSSLAGFASIQTVAQQKIPFSYFYSMKATWLSLVASSTANAPTYSFQLHDIGLGSTTPMGNILPNFVGFSSSTVTSYFPAGLFDVFKALASLAIILGLFADIFFTVKYLPK